MKLSIKYFLTILSAAFIFTSCIKNDVVKLGDKGTPRVRIQEAPDQLQYLSPFTGDKVVDLFTLIRDEVSNSAINQPLTITLTTSSTGLDAFNTANGTDYLELLPSSFTIVPGNGIEDKGNGQYAVTFAPGVSNVAFSVKINSSTWNFAGINALDFSITNSAGKEIAAGKNEIVTAIGVKNKYDGSYELRGHHNRVPYNFQYIVMMDLATAAPDKVAFYWPDAGSTGHPIGLSSDPTDVSWYGAAISPVLTFDVNTNQIIDAYNIGGATPISLYTSAQGPDALPNLYDPAKKTVYVSWMYNNNPARAFFDTLVYKKSR